MRQSSKAAQDTPGLAVGGNGRYVPLVLDMPFGLQCFVGSTRLAASPSQQFMGCFTPSAIPAYDPAYAVLPGGSSPDSVEICSQIVVTEALSRPSSCQ